MKANVSKEYIKLELHELQDYEHNVKKHGKNIDDIKLSIQKDTYIAPIIVDENNVIISGHGRKQALVELWYSEVDVIRVKGLTDEQKKRYRIMDNKLAEISPWDIWNLESEIKDLVNLGDEDIMWYFDMDISMGDDLEVREADEDIGRNYTKEDFDHSWIKTFILHYADEEYVSLIDNLTKLVESGKYWDDFSWVIANLANESASSL